MADEELAPVEGVAVGDDAPAAEDVAVDLPAANPVEALAAEMGWAPKESWRGDPEAWKDAATFVKSTADINRHLSRDLKAVREEMANVSKVTSSIMADKVAERDEYWKAQRAAAVEAGDVEAADRAYDELSKLKAQPAATAVPPETQSFVERNASWFNKDPLATRRAIDIAQVYSDAGYSPAEQVAKAETQMRKEFPELFPTPAKPQAQVAAPTNRTGSVGNRAKGFVDIPADSQAVLRDFHERNGISLERLAKSYWAEKTKEKVG